MKLISPLKLALVLTLFLLIMFLFEAHAQCNDEKSPDGLSWDFDEGNSEDFSIGIFLSEIFTPQIIIDTKHIRQYILDERFQVLRNQCGDMRTIDAIYLKSLKIADYNIARALFLSFLAVLEHRTVDFIMPIVNPLKVPLTFEKDSVFFARMKHLPTHVYSDSPTTHGGDRDKLQHFFGSAYLSYTSEAPQFAKAVGDFIEWGEPIFIVGGTDDPRDKHANKQGESFGRDLLVVTTLLPSDYLTFQYEDRK
ncbi:MAG: hypothetical protein ABSA44_06970 [Bacteroidota bacterium]|jgi:hypothetical protein